MAAYPIYHCNHCRHRNVPVSVLGRETFCDLCGGYLETASLYTVDMPTSPGDFTVVGIRETRITVVELRDVVPTWCTPETTN